jgi:hypothetical protein
MVRQRWGDIGKMKNELAVGCWPLAVGLRLLAVGGRCSELKGWI